MSKGLWISDEVMRNSELDWSCKALLSVYQYFTINGYEKCCKMTDGKLAEMLGLSDRTIRRCKAKLKKDGYITHNGGIRICYKEGQVDQEAGQDNKEAGQVDQEEGQVDQKEGQVVLEEGQVDLEEGQVDHHNNKEIKNNKKEINDTDNRSDLSNPYITSSNRFNWDRFNNQFKQLNDYSRFNDEVHAIRTAITETYPKAKAEKVLADINTTIQKVECNCKQQKQPKPKPKPIPKPKVECWKLESIESL